MKYLSKKRILIAAAVTFLGFSIIEIKFGLFENLFKYERDGDTFENSEQNRAECFAEDCTAIAKQENNNLPKEREITQEIKEDLDKHFPSNLKGGIRIHYASQSIEAKNFANKIEAYLKEENRIVENSPELFYSGILNSFGYHIMVGNGEGIIYVGSQI